MKFLLALLLALSSSLSGAAEYTSIGSFGTPTMGADCGTGPALAGTDAAGSLMTMTFAASSPGATIWYLCRLK